ncbi:MAG: monooxygenase [Polyangiales bacterium]
MRLALVALPLFATCALACGSTSDTPTPTPGLPQPSHGLQLHIPAFPVAQGSEVQHCYYFKLPSDVDIEVTRFEVSYREGSHHMNLFRTLKDLPDHDEECFTPMDFTTPTNPNGVDLIIGSQKGALDWKMPPGVAFKLKARTQLVLQTHYVNASTQKGDQGEVWVNLHTAQDPASITAHVGTMFANNMQIKLPPHEESSFTTGCAVPHDVNVIAATGHFHSRGRRFTVAACPEDMTKADAPFYQSKSWDEPPFVALDTPIPLKAGGGLEYTCEFFNDTNTEIKFGPKVETNEHCNLFAYFYPWEEDHARYCF